MAANKSPGNKPPSNKNKATYTQKRQQTPAEKPKTGGRPKSGQRGMVVLIAGVLVLLVISWIVVQATGTAPSVSISGSLPASGASSTAQPGSAASLPVVDTAAWNIAGPIPQAQENVQLVTPDYRMIALPENGRVDMKYFDTVTFVGDSITQGLQLYGSGIPNATYCAYKNIGPLQVYNGSEWPNANKDMEVPMDALVASQPDNVYVLLGANAMGNVQDDVLMEYYRTMLQKMREALLPGVGIYVQSITPVRPDAKFNMEQITALNNRLAQLAYEEGVYFLDLNEPLAGDDGYLREEFGGYDGIHMTAEGYAAWVDYLVTHTAYHPRSPYLVGSPYYTPPQPAANPEEKAA